MKIGPQLNPYPTRPMVVADPSKLNYFAQANSARFGLQHTAGALRGFDEAPTQEAPVNAKDLGAGIGAGVGSFLNQLFPTLNPNRGYPLDGAKGNTVPVSDPTILGLPPSVVYVAGGLLVVGLGWKFFKKR